jgi:selenide,water dikinase
MNGRGGCQCKLPGLDLEELLEAVGANASQSGTAIDYPEDCAVVELGEFRLLLSTDFVPLVGLDLFAAGGIAALHSMSDIFASGGIPKWALVNLIVDGSRPIEYAKAVLAGVIDQCAKEGAQLVGGQTVVGQEAMVGLSVVGVPLGNRILRKGGSLPGDSLLLSKPLGVGLVLRGFKLGLLDEAALDSAITTMTISNAHASAVALESGVNACTDVTGYGLLGHLSQMLAPTLGAMIDLPQIPILPQAKGLPAAALRTVWTEGNYEYATTRMRIATTLPFDLLAVLVDPQTNGGLLVSARPDSVDQLRCAGFISIGTVTDSGVVDIRS